MVELGDQVKDKVTGFEGIAVGRHIFLQGCHRISVQPPIDKEGKHPESVSFDEPQLIVKKAGVVTTEPEPVPPKVRTGGPMPYKDTPRREGFGRC